LLTIHPIALEYFLPASITTALCENSKSAGFVIPPFTRVFHPMQQRFGGSGFNFTHDPVNVNVAAPNAVSFAHSESVDASGVIASIETPHFGVRGCGWVSFVHVIFIYIFSLDPSLVCLSHSRISLLLLVAAITKK